MSIGTEVFIQTTTVDGLIVTNQVTQSIIGIPGAQGAAGAAGPAGADGVGMLGSFAVDAVPAAATVPLGSLIYVGNEVHGPVMAFSDGVAWRRTTDRGEIYAPPVGASLDLNFTAGYFSSSSDTNPNNITAKPASSILSCARATTGWAEAADGALTEFAPNVLRITDKGLLVEGASTNRITSSNDLSAAGWTLIGGAAVSPGIGALTPDGVTNGDVLSIPVDNSQAAFAVTHTPAAGESWTFSAWLRGTAGETVNIYVDRQAGGASQVSQTDIVLTAGWQRVSVTHVFTAGPTEIFAAIRNSATTNAVSVEVWGAQFEQAEQATSLIKTAGTAVTRAADNVQFSDLLWSNGAVGTFALETSACTSTFGRLFYGGVSLQPYFPSSIAINLNLLTAALGGLTKFDTLKTALAWDAGGRSIVAGGGALVTDAVAATISAPLYLGNRPALDRALNGYIRSISYWPIRKSNAELNALV